MTPMTKNLWRELRAGWGRFVAISLIILLGCLIFVGVKAAGPGLNESLTTTVQRAHLADVQAVSSTGFTTADVRAAKTNGAQAEAVKYTTATAGANDWAVALYGYAKGQTLNRLTLRSGHLPQAANQIVLDQRAKTDYAYKLGQTIKLTAGTLRRSRFTIVGFADSPQYVDSSLRGAANVGDGTLRFFAYVPASQLDQPKTLLAVRYPKLQAANTFARDYKHAVATKKAALIRRFKPRATARSKSLYAKATKQLGAQATKLAAAQTQLTAAKQQVAAASGGTVTTTAAITAQEKTLAAAQTKLQAARTKAKAASTTTYTWQTRSDLPGFSAFGDTSTRIAAIANVFPVFFFLIAALITFTTITRMVEEARGQIGTFKALGYGQWAIARNYLQYAVMAAVLGSVLGGWLGNELLPRFILSMYHMAIPMTPTIHLQWGALGLAIAASLVATVGAAGYVVRQELHEGPAALLLPKAPKSAKRIWLEYIRPLWSRLNFNQKVSYRNMFRYKSRMVMSIVGVAGGCALILTGFGIRDSITATGTRQYGDIVKYAAVVRLNSAADVKPAQTVLAKSSAYRSSTAIDAASAKLTHSGHTVTAVNLFTPQTTQFKRYVTLTSTAGQPVTLPSRGAVISQKTATALRLQAGQRVTVTTGGATRRVKIAAVVKNYIGDYLYMSAAAKRAAFGQTAPNSLLVALRKTTANQRNAIGRRLLAANVARGTSFTADQRQSITSMGNTMTPVVVIFVVMSALLSFVVMINLTNINVAERLRELSTVKVLGFYDREVTLYVTRENIGLTLVGIVLGFGVGNALTWYILRQAETALVMFPLTIHWPGYVAAAALMLLFTGIVMAVTHRRLQHVDMVAALKATE